VLVDLLPPSARHAFDDGTVDPHFWSDPQAVMSLLPVLADTLCAIDAHGCSTFQANADSLSTALATLDTRLQSMMQPVRDTPVLLAQPFFRYFLHRYGPRLVGLVEPSPGAEPTPRQLQALVQTAETTGARFILTQRSLSARGAQAVAESAAMPLVSLDPLGGTRGRETYPELLLDNARILRDSLVRSP
jgi:zinc transport system substrate-binding protein